MAGLAVAQNPPQQPGPINPPILPVTSPTGKFGPTLSPPTTNTNFPNPNNSTWTALGPAPLNEGGSASGRIAAVAVDPTNSNNIYIAAAGGGVWQTTDGGASYSPLTDTQSTLSMGAIAIAPSNHLKIYAGTGEANNSLDSNFGTGILVSNNGGATWTLSTGPGGVFNRRSIAKISVDPTTDQVAYAAVGDFAENGLCCSGTGIYKTTDGGATWTNVTSAAGLDASFPWSDVVVDPNSHTIIYAAHGDPFADNSANGVYRSLDSGATWALLGNAPSGNGIGRIALAVAPSASSAGSHVLYVAVAKPTNNGATLFEMLRSDNADATTPTFTDLASTPNFGGDGAQAWYNWVIGVDPLNSANVYAAGALTYQYYTHNVIRSTNSGATWIDITTVGGIEPHTDCHGMAFDASSRLLLGNDGGIWRYDPTGAGSWSNLNGNLNTIQFTGIGVHPTSVQTVIGGSQDNGTELASGSTLWNLTWGGDGGFAQISQTNPNICYTTNTGASLVVSTDGCNSWISRTPTVSNGNLFDFYAPIFVDRLNGNRVFLGGDNLYESTNAGVNWTSHTSPDTNPINTIAVVPGGNTIYISTGSGIWVSTSDGSAWTKYNLPVGGRVSELDIDPNDPTGNTVVAVIGNFNGASGQVYRTINGGALWTNISGNVPALPTWSAKIGTDTNKTIYVSDEIGVFSSPSPYGTWTAVGSGLPHAQGVHLELNLNLGELALATHGRGAWFFSTPLPSVPGQVTLTSPGSGAVNQSTTPTLNWSASNNATSYDLYLGTSNPPPVYAQNLSGISFGVTTALNAGTPYFWNVVAKNSAGSAPASSTWSFTTTSLTGPPTTGLIGYWNFDEGSGSVAHDTSGSGYNGVVSGATWTTGKINSALMFSVNTNSVTTPSIALGNTFSLSAWVNPTVLAQTSYVRIAETYYATGLYLGTNAAGTAYKFILTNGSGVTGSCSGAVYGCAEGGTISSGWHLVTATYDGATARLYVDNALVGSDTFTAPGNTNLPLYIGHSVYGNGYNGAIDEVRLYNRALTATEVTTIYNYTGK
jgi:photosystem II stability/assembly factor-like uncharacterized protein